MIDVVTETLIEKPIERVAGFAADPANAPTWYENISSAELLSPPPLVEGSRIAFEAKFLGRTLTYTYAVTDLDPGRRLVMRTAQGPFEMETTYEWEPIGAEKTRMTLRNRGGPPGFWRFAAPLMSAAIRRENRNDLRRIKTILEAGAA